MIHFRWALSLERRGIRSFSTISPSPTNPEAGRAGAGSPLSFELLAHRRRRSLGVAPTNWEAHDVTLSSQWNRAAASILMPITHRAFHSSPALRASNRRRVRASSVRKKKKREMIKEMKAKVKKRKQPKSSGPTRVGQIPNPIKRIQRNQLEDVPRAFLAKTASDHAYVARCAIMDESTGEVHVDPSSLFEELNGAMQQKRGGTQRQRQSFHLPHAFRNSHLEYFSPASFPDHEPPRGGAPEVAFLGRSNAGKSSLINALSSLILSGGGGGGAGPSHAAGSGGGELARTSKRPGRTQTVNYFGLVPDDAVPSSPLSSLTSTAGNKRSTNPALSKMYLVDLPGFGYASAPGESVDEWQRKTQEFLIARSSSPDIGGAEGVRPWPERWAAATQTQSGRSYRRDTAIPPLRRLYLLLDARLPDPAAIDLTVMGWCDEHSIPYTVVLTKVDGTSRANCVKLTNQVCMRFHSLFHDAGRHDGEDQEEEEEDGEDGQVCMDPVIYWTSAKDLLGMEELLMSVENNLYAPEHWVEDQSEEDVDGCGIFALERDGLPGMGTR